MGLRGRGRPSCLGVVFLRARSAFKDPGEVSGSAPDPGPAPRVVWGSAPGRGPVLGMAWAAAPGRRVWVAQLPGERYRASAGCVVALGMAGTGTGAGAGRQSALGRAAWTSVAFPPIFMALLFGGARV